MSDPLSYARFIKALKGEGLTVYEHETGGRSPQYHNRNHKGPWGSVNGVMIHHTVTRGHDSTISICRKGYASLPGPLCHGVICKQGHVHVVGYGRANHAGLGDDDVLRAVVDERPLPADNEANTDGNRHFYGFECENLGDGKDPWPAAQLDAIERAAAAICRAHGWNERSVIGHREWQPGKIDPRGFTMASMRSRVKGRLAGAPSNSNEEDNMPTPEEIWNADVVNASPPPYNNSDWSKGNRKWTADYALGSAVLTGRKTEAKVDALAKQVAGLTAAVTKLAGLVGSGVDTDQVVAAVEKAIADAVVKVDVDITGTES